MCTDFHLARSSTFFKTGMWFRLVKSASLGETLMPKNLIYRDCNDVNEELWKKQLIRGIDDFNQFIQ